MFQAYSAIFNVRHIEEYLPTFGYISTDSGIFRILTQFHIFMYVQAYLQCMPYPGIFRSIDIFIHFQVRYSGITQEQFTHILNIVWADSGIFRTLAYLGT